MLGLSACGGSSDNSDANSTANIDESPAEENINMALVENTGLWKGSANQAHSSWAIEITLSVAEQTVYYPSFNCGGTLTLLNHDDTSLLFRETITFGQSSCVDLGLVELIEDGDNSLLYNYYYDNNQTISLGAWGSVQRLP